MKGFKKNLVEFESKVIKRFVDKNKRDRYLQFIQSEKNRSGFTGQLAHFNDLKYELFEEVRGNEIAVIKAKFEEFGKYRDCYLISENADFDQKHMDINKALNEIIGFGFGTLLIVGDAELVFYEGEGPKNRWMTKSIYKMH